MKKEAKKYRPAVFVVAYKRRGKKIEYLVLKRILHWKGWEFPKGGIEPKETKKQTVFRELKEETHLVPIKITKFNKSGRYSYSENAKRARPGFHGQTYSLYAAEVKKGKVKYDKKEHDGHKWLSFSQALKKLTWPNQRNCLRIVNRFLELNCRSYSEF
jgi:8-oxo-dGTP pyrophosphatase MutT (NUDIX family)